MAPETRVVNGLILYRTPMVKGIQCGRPITMVTS